MKYRNGLIAGLACLFATASVVAADAEPAKTEAPKKTAPEPAKCTHAPGSRIRLAVPEDCAKAARGPYRSYTKEDLERTGAVDIAEALRKLDPSFR